jgi:hypothetical protein
MTLFENIFKESMSKEQEQEYFPPSFDPCTDREWNIAPNIDDYDGALFAVMERIAFEKWDLNDRECKEIAHAVSNALWAGYHAGFKRGKDEAV